MHGNLCARARLTQDGLSVTVKPLTTTSMAAGGRAIEVIERKIVYERGGPWRRPSTGLHRVARAWQRLARATDRIEPDPNSGRKEAVMNSRFIRGARRAVTGSVLGILGLLSTTSAQASQVGPVAAPAAVLFRDVRVYDGKGSELSGPANVLVRGQTIERISTAPITTTGQTASLTVIDGNGRTLMPGLIDNHWHTTLARASPTQAVEGDLGYTNLLAGAEAEATLMRGFTSVRDLGGPSFGLKRAIDEGLVIGPRIYPSGAIITITGGHGDFRSPSDLPRQLGGPLVRMEVLMGSMVADSADEVRVRAREQLLLGASQIKLTAGGGVASPHSPLDVSTFNEDELRAAVQAAENWGTYVCTHAYTPVSIRRSIAAGVKVIEHGHLMDDATARLMAEKGIWLSFQPFTDDTPIPPMAPANLARLAQVITGTDRTIALVKKYNIKMAIGTDLLFSPTGAALQGVELVKMARWFSPAEVLRMATSTNADLLKLSGPRDPYPGRLGVVEEGALADLLLVDGNPLEHIGLIADAGRTLVVIMKDGTIYKNLLAK
jgi:imidazolonepropionase-like amidohydrolase